MRDGSDRHARPSV